MSKKTTIIPNIKDKFYVRINRCTGDYWKDRTRIRNLLIFGIKNGFQIEGKTITQFTELNPIVDRIYHSTHGTSFPCPPRYLVFENNTITASTEKLTWSQEREKADAEKIVFLSYREARKIAA